MNPKVHVDREIVALLYQKYKSYLLPMLFFAVSWIVFFVYVFPSLQQFFALRDQITASEETIAQMQQNYNTLLQMDNTKLTGQLAIANAALPAEPDYAGILTTISNATGQSGVTLNDYSFQVGNLTTGTPGSSGNQTVQLSLSLQGDIGTLKKFMTALSQSLPLSEIAQIAITSPTTANVSANFFYIPENKPLFNPANPLPVLTATQENLLGTLSSENGQTTNSPVDSVISPSPITSIAPIPRISLSPAPAVSQALRSSSSASQ